MKNWFNDLENNRKLLLIIGLYVATFLFAEISQYAEFFSLLCVGCLIFAIIFTVFYVKYKKSNTSQKSNYQNNSDIKIISNITDNQTAQPVKNIESDVTFLKIEDGYYLRWQYKENIAIAQNLDKVQLKDCDIDLVPEPDNQYDSNAVALYKGEHKLGYLYKGQTQEMVLSYLDHKNYRIKTVVCLLDQENNKLAVRIAFYRDIDSVQLDTLTFSLTKISKKADFVSSRYENVSTMNVGDYVEIFDNYNGSYTVCDECGNELGELNAKKIEDIFDDIIYAKIADIELTENDAYKVKISIFYR